MKQKFFSILLISLIIGLAGCQIQRSDSSQSTPPTSAETVTTPTAPPKSGCVDCDSSYQLPQPVQGISYVPGQALVKFNVDTTAQFFSKAATSPGFTIEAAAADPALGVLGIESLEPLIAPVAQASGASIDVVVEKSGSSSQLFIASFDEKQDVETTVEALNALPYVEYAEANFVAYATGNPTRLPLQFVPNDPNFPYQWHFQNIQLQDAWDVSSGDGVIVAILDTGAAYENYEIFLQAPDLAATRFVTGYDFVNNDSHSNDDNGHGTHVAGTIAQSTNNGLGVTGVAYNASIMPIKVLDALGQGSFANIIQGLNYASVKGAKVVNMSLSAPTGSTALKEALDQTKANGITLVAAAGNNGGPVEYPARYDSVIAVGATRFDNTRVNYSNMGRELDLVAPGGDNTVDQNGDGFGDGILQQTFRNSEINEFGYLFFQGTSMAAPHVSGVAALLLSKNPGATPEQIKAVLKTSALPLKPSDQYGAGLLQACNALTAIGAQCGNVTPPTVTPTSPGNITPTPTPTSTPPGNITPTPTATSTPITPPAAGNIIINGSFETDEAWIFPRTEYQGRYTTDLAHSGNRSAVVGITDPYQDRYSYSSVSQKVTIPADATKATLNAFVYPVSAEHPYSANAQMTLILNNRFRVIETLSRSLSNEQTWQQQSFDLSKYRGQTIYIYFGAVNARRNGKVTALYVDDVSLVVEK